MPTQLTRGAREDPTTRFRNLLAATFRARLRAVAAHHRFRVVKVELLRPLQRAPLVIVQPMSKAALAASTRAILNRLDPPARTISGRRVSAYEGFLLEAQDAHGEPYAIVDRSLRTRNIAGWFDRRDFVPVPSAFS